MSDTKPVVSSVYSEYLDEFFGLHHLLDPKDIPDGVTGTPWEVTDEKKMDHFWKRFLNAKVDPHKRHEFLTKSGESTLYKALKKFPYGCLTPVLLLGKDLNEVFDDMISKAGEEHPTPPYETVEDFIKEMEQVRDIVTEALVNGSVSSSAPTTENSEGFKRPDIDAPISKAIDTLLSQAGAPSIEELFDLASKTDEVRTQLTSDIEGLKSAYNKDIDARKKEHDKTLKDLKEVSDTLSKMSLMPTLPEVSVAADGVIPEGKLVYKKASEIFPDIKLENDFENVPTWEWDGVHPDVPMIDEAYIFRPDLLSKVLYALITNQRMYLQGDTGSGKTTLIEQVAAHLNYPFLRINFDSEITRMDLIGRDVLKDGASHFVDGMLPKAMSGPYITCFDEIDFVRPDIAYVMQAALEGNGLRITEDGDRLVTPDPSFRMFGTGNTVGQGDEQGMYQGARPQSLAFLDRFTVWANVPYLEPAQREDLIKRKVPALKPEDRKALVQYTNEHLELFQGAKVLQPISPRGMLAVARAATVFSLKDALKMTILDRASSDDKSALAGIVDRVV